jgi:hypothetical protein
MKTITLTLAIVMTLAATKSLAATSNNRPNVKDVLEQIAVGTAPTREGLPTQYGQPDETELLAQKESTIEQIKNALIESKKLAVGARIDFYSNAAATIVVDSGSRPTEAAARITLNRAVDVVNGTIAVSGANETMVASWLANLLEKSFVLAAAYVNNPACVVTSHKVSSLQPEDCLQTLPIAKIGYDISQLLWRSHASLVSNSAKAIVIIKMLQYLAYDLNNDPRRSEDDFVSIYKKIRKIQVVNQNYKNIVASLAASQEPDTRDLSAISVAVDNIYTAIPAILAK